VAARILALSACLFAAVAQAQPAAEIDLYVRAGCPHCERAEAFMDQLGERAELELHVHQILESPQALEELRRLTEELGYAQIGVPVIVVRTPDAPEPKIWMGFDDPSTTGAQIESWLTGARAGEDGAEIDLVHLPLLGETHPDELGLPLFTIVVGLLDGFNPCAMWVLLFLLSLLVHVKSRPRMALIAGTFVVVSGLVYFAFMAAWLSLFMLIGASRWVQVGLGLVALGIGALHVKDFFAFGKGPSLSIPESAKPGIYAKVRRIIHAENLPAAMALVVSLAVGVNLVELLCTAGLPAVYTQVLAAHDVSTGERYLYLALYNLAYMADDTVMVVIGIVTLSRKKLQERGGRVLKLVSGAVMLALGLLLLVAPELLQWG
jgi:glutaredoxin